LSKNKKRGWGWDILIEGKKNDLRKKVDYDDFTDPSTRQFKNLLQTKKTKDLGEGFLGGGNSLKYVTLTDRTEKLI